MTRPGPAQPQPWSPGVGRAFPPLDTANRSFATMVAVALAPVLLLAVAGCGVLGFVAYRIAGDGVSAITGAEDLRPAVALVVVMAIGFVLGLHALVHQLRATGRLHEAIESARVPSSTRLRDLAERCRLENRVVLVAADEPFSLAYGIGAPRVVISTRLLDALDDEQAVAVLEHERYHLRARDPLKVVVARTLTATFFYLPVLPALGRRYLAGREIAADRRAVAASGPAALAGALYHAVAGPRWADLGGAAALGGADLLEERVRHLETGDEPPPAPLSVAALVVTGLVLVLVVAALVYTVAEAGGPAGLMQERMNGGMDDMGSRGVGDVLLSLTPWVLVAGWVWHWKRRRHR